jgi:hypothetical protein
MMIRTFVGREAPHKSPRPNCYGFFLSNYSFLPQINLRYWVHPSFVGGAGFTHATHKTGMHSQYLL